MLGCNQALTLWLRKKIPVPNNANNASKEIFVRHILPVKCKWKNCTEQSVSSGTSVVYNSTVIIIPYFDGISELEIKEGDIAAVGIYDIEITGTAPFTSGYLKQLLAPDITAIKSVSYNDTDGMKGKHLRLTGN